MTECDRWMDTIWTPFWPNLKQLEERTEYLPARGRTAAAVAPNPPELHVHKDLPVDPLFPDERDDPHGTLALMTQA